MMNFEEFCAQPSLKNENNIYKIFYYIIGVSQNEDYEVAMNYILPYLGSEEKQLQIAAIQGLYTLVDRFVDIDEIVLDLLIENLKSQNNDILNETLSTLNLIAQCILKYRKEIFFSFLKNNYDLYSYRHLKKYTNLKELTLLNTIEKKEEFILSFCQHSSNYNEAFSICLDFLQKDECEELNIAAIQGLIYLVMRFEQIELHLLEPIFLKFLDAANGEIIGSKYGGELIYIESLLVDIAYYIPALKPQAIEMLRGMESSYIKRYKLEEIE